MKVWLLLPSILVLLGGCGVDDWINRKTTERYQKQCESFGFTSGTTAFSNCMMQQDAQDAETNRRIQDRIALDEAAEKIKKGK